MKTETITAPPARLSPEMRYASLHRTIENGMDSDRTWLELIQICVELDRRDEARRAFGHIHDTNLRRRAFNLLLAAGVQVELPVAEGIAIASGLHASGPHATRRLIDWIADAFRFLFQDHMPLTVVVATVTFPLVVGLGGILTAGVHNSLLLPLIALVPALSVVGLIGALGRRILVEASQGLDDAPEVPSFGSLAREAGRFLVDGTVLSALFLGPGLALASFTDVGISAIASAFAVGGTLLPMALAMRQTRDDWACLSPMALFSNIRRAGPRYFVAVLASFVLMAPAAVSFWLTAGSALYLVISVVGPLVVVPIFVISRLFGQTMIDIERDRVDEERQLAAAQRVVTQAPPVLATAAPARASLRAPVHPESGRNDSTVTAPAASVARSIATAQPSQAAPKPAAPAKPQVQRTQAPRAAAPATPAPRAPQPAAPAKRRPGTSDVPGGSVGLRSDRAAAPKASSRSVAPPEPNPMRASAAAEPAAPANPPQAATPAAPPVPRLRPRDDQRSPSTPAPQRYRSASASVVGEEIPDLTKLPGVSVLRGSARVAAGAAAPTRPID